MGKASKMQREKFNDLDIMKSLLFTLTVNIGQLIGLYAQLE